MEAVVSGTYTCHVDPLMLTIRLGGWHRKKGVATKSRVVTLSHALPHVSWQRIIQKRS
jgi:hypothetical protein